MKLTLKEQRAEAPGAVSFIFDPAEPIAWKAGQFFHFVLHHEPTDNRGSDRWFTAASAPCEKRIMITTRLAPENGSTFKQALQALKTGDTIEISDLDGDFVIENPARECVFLAAGIGITPIRSILKELDHAGTRIKATLLYANRDRNLVYQEELEGFAKRNPSLKIVYAISPERIEETKIRQLAPDLQNPLFYVSGPEPMVENLGNTLKSMGVPSDHLKQDWFPGYPAEQ